MPSRFHTLELTVASRALGEICFSRDTMPDGTVCNAAFLPEQRDSVLLGRAFIGNGYTALSTADQFIYQPISKEFLQTLFQNQNVTSVEAHIGLTFSSKHFSAGFSPYRVQYVSEIHNPNLPVIAIHASVERSFTLAGGIPLEMLDRSLGGFSFGTRARLLQRKYVHGSFSMFQAISDDPRALLPTKSQTAVLLDPTLGWTSPKTLWKPRASLGLSNLGKTWPDDALFPISTDLTAGLGVEPPVKFGRFRVGLDLVNLLYAPDLLSRTRLGTSYQFGVVEIMAGMNAHSLSGGLEMGLQIIQVGIVYEFIRDDFGGTSPESRISTEIAIRL